MKILLVACNAKYIHSNLAVYDLQAYASDYAGRVELVTGEGDRLNLKSKLSQYVSLANIFSGGEIPELEIVAYEKDDIDKLMSFMING